MQFIYNCLRSLPSSFWCPRPVVLSILFYEADLWPGNWVGKWPFDVGTPAPISHNVWSLAVRCSRRSPITGQCAAFEYAGKTSGIKRAARQKSLAYHSRRRRPIRSAGGQSGALETKRQTVDQSGGPRTNPADCGPIRRTADQSGGLVTAWTYRRTRNELEPNPVARRDQSDGLVAQQSQTAPFVCTGEVTGWPVRIRSSLSVGSGRPRISSAGRAGPDLSPVTARYVIRTRRSAASDASWRAVFI